MAERPAVANSRIGDAQGREGRVVHCMCLGCHEVPHGRWVWAAESSHVRLPARGAIGAGSRHDRCLVVLATGMVAAVMVAAVMVAAGMVAAGMAKAGMVTAVMVAATHAQYQAWPAVSSDTCAESACDAYMRAAGAARVDLAGSEKPRWRFIARVALEAALGRCGCAHWHKRSQTFAPCSCTLLHLPLVARVELRRPKPGAENLGWCDPVFLAMWLGVGVMRGSHPSSQ